MLEPCGRVYATAVGGSTMTSLSPPASQPSTDNRIPTVIYVMGAGRSGSTVLGVALGNCANVFYAGELEAWLRRSGNPNFGGAARTQFWNSVRQNVHGDDLFGDKAWRCLEYSLALFRVYNRPGRRRLRPRYGQTTERLYRTIASSAQATHIVDTSHYPLRANELQSLSGIDLYLVYLVRNPLSVVASFKRRDVTNVPKSLMATNAYLCLTHLLSIFVFLRHRTDRRLLLRYEDFSANPEPVMRDLLKWIGVSAPLPDLASLETGIPFQGNRLLESESIALRGGRSLALPSSCESWITKLFQLPWALAFSRLTPNAQDLHV
jgi:hypothetical protein